MEVAASFLQGFLQIFTWPTLSMMLVGILTGVVVGILPGLGGPTTLALMLPFIFRMTPVEAFAFLLGMAAVTGTTGDITSILFGVPGETTTAATVVDGHPMAKKGEAGRALGAALMSSLVGAIFGAFVLATAIPVVRPLVLSFGSPEFFLIAILGVSFIAALSGGSPLKGLIMGGLGLMLATVGRDPISGIQRYTFDQVFLWDGIGLVPVTIGLFAIPETIDLAVQGSGIAQKQVGKLGGVLEGVKDTFRHWRLVIRCSAIGTLAGIMPGLGGSVGQWMAYAHAVQSSPDQDRFGKGAVEGVLGPGAANNSSSGGSLIPTIAFGVPGSIPTAILLGAFMIQGLVPGPDMLLPEVRGGHLSVTFSFVWIIVFSNLITVALFFLFLNQLVKITQVRGSLLIPFILMLVYLGAFAEKNASADLFLVLIFGLLGWVMVKLDWPRPPLILGLVLAPVAEQKLFLSTGRYGAAWLGRPGVIILILLALAAIFYPEFKRRRKKRAGETKKEREALSQAVAEAKTAPSGSLWGALFSFFLVLLFGLALLQSKEWTIRAGLFPWIIGFPVLGLTLAQAVIELRNMSWTPRAAREEEKFTEALEFQRTLSILGWTVGYFAALWLIGFTFAVPTMTFLYLKIVGRENWSMSVALAAVAWAFLYFLFVSILHVPFPEGLLFNFLGAAG
jgi:TctA family transporter